MREILDIATDPGVFESIVWNLKYFAARRYSSSNGTSNEGRAGKAGKYLRSEGMKESAIRVAEGEKEAAILRAEAKKETAIREAEGHAQAILKMQEATARGLSMIKEVGLDAQVIALESLKTMEKVANGQATKIIVPSELQNLAVLGTVLKESTDATSLVPSASSNHPHA